MIDENTKIYVNPARRFVLGGPAADTGLTGRKIIKNQCKGRRETYMNYKIVVDSCCDITPRMKEQFGITSVPLTMLLGSKEFVDDDSLNIDEFMNQMKACTEKVGSASPPPILYREAIEDIETTFVVTLSSQLSSSYSNAAMAKSFAEETNAGDVYIFDSKSASAGETLIAIKLHQLLAAGNPKEQVVGTIKKFIDNMKTYFVLENYDNLQKNGRLSKLKGKLIQMLGIKLIMGADGEGSIALYEKPRGVRQMIRLMLSLIEKSGRDTEGGSLVISHCNNPELAEQLSAEIQRQFHFSDIFIVPTGGLSSLYADDKGIVIAF